MKNELAIENFNEIPVQEQQDINGGFWQIVISIGIIAVGEIIDDWDNFKNGLTGRPEEKNP
jgi:uncharacterized protein YkvS